MSDNNYVDTERTEDGLTIEAYIPHGDGNGEAIRQLRNSIPVGIVMELVDNADQ